MVLATTFEHQATGFGWNTDFFSDLLLDSSGGRLRRFFSDSSGCRGELRLLPGLKSEENSNSRAIASPLEKRLKDIGETFNLNRMQLAKACNVTRRALYSWLDGTEPRRDALQRIAALHRASLDWKRSGFPKPEAALQLPMISGKSLLDLLTADTLDLEAVHFLGSRLKFNEVIELEAELEDPFR